jgi:O-antigen ligase
VATLPRMFALTAVIVLMTVVSTGAYTAAPGVAYLIILGVSGLVLSNPILRRSPLRYLQPLRLTGILTLSAFFLFVSMRLSVEPRVQLAYPISFYVFLLSFAAIQLTQYPQKEEARRPNTAIRLAVLLTLFLIIGAQIAETLGYISGDLVRRNAADLSIGQRPGGFLNVNIAAATALALVYVFFEMEQLPTRLLSTLCVVLFGVVLLVSQSRAAMLFGTLYIATLILRDRLSLGALASAVVLAIGGYLLFVDDAQLVEVLMESIATRFDEDNSFNERLALIRIGTELLGEAPLWGHGYRYVEHLTGRSSHNEIIENAVNFGVLGSVVVWGSFFAIYQPRSISFLLACIAPVLFFSHNFFETASFQVALGLACGIAALRHTRLPELATQPRPVGTAATRAG